MYKTKKVLFSALEMACPGNWIRSFIDAGQPVASLLKQIAQGEDSGQKEFALKILNELSRKPAQPPPSLQAFRTPAPLHSPRLEGLTSRKNELLPLLAQGLSNKEIAARLCVSDLTVKTHLQNIYSKLGVKGRLEAVNKSGLLQNPSSENS